VPFTIILPPCCCLLLLYIRKNEFWQPKLFVRIQESSTSYIYSTRIDTSDSSVPLFLHRAALHVVHDRYSAVLLSPPNIIESGMNSDSRSSLCAYKSPIQRERLYLRLPCATTRRFHASLLSSRLSFGLQLLTILSTGPHTHTHTQREREREREKERERKRERERERDVPQIAIRISPPLSREPSLEPSLFRPAVINDTINRTWHTPTQRERERERETVPQIALRVSPPLSREPSLEPSLFRPAVSNDTISRTWSVALTTYTALISI
jgi:hypothetical protein